MEEKEVSGMMIIRLLGTLAVLSLLMAPALSEHTAKVCTCTSGGCHGSNGMNCCGKCSNESCISQACACSSQISLSSSIEVYDLSYSYLGKGSSRPYVKQSPSTSFSGSGHGSAYSGPSLANSANTGPPDLDVVEFLPPSAKQVYGVLVSDGPLTQKDLISKTDLPPRTVRYALSRLKGEDILEERFCFQDARQSLYTLSGAAPK
jgi:DNA-binding transcriptional ArsR family regulator